jgi:hypothetical protein
VRAIYRGRGSASMIVRLLGIRMRRQFFLAAVSLLALSGAAGAAFAQEAAPIEVGGSVDGEIAAGDFTGPDEAYRYDAWTFEARAGQRLEAVMRSGAFDAFLEVRAGEDAGDALASDDDGLGEGTDSRLRFTAERDGTYVLRARTLSGLTGGAYTLSLAERAAAAPAPEPTPVRVGETVAGEIVADKDAETEDGLTYDAWSFRAGAGDRVSIALDSDAFDPVVRVGRMAGGDFTELAMNDDGPEAGLNSRLMFTAPADGEYVIRVTPLANGASGPYSLTLAEGPRPPQARRIGIGDTVRGELSDGDARTEGDVPVDAYSFTGRAGQRARIDMSSEAFDTFVELFDGDRASLATDDDGAPEGTNSRLVFTLPESGTYTIEARAFSTATGDYSLTLEEIAPERPPQALPFGQVIEGEIGEGDSRDDEDRGFDGFTFQGREGQRIQAIMRSGDFDTYVQIGRPGEPFTPLASDDDGLGEGTDSRLSFTLPADGDYVLRASPLGSDGKGLYSLELVDRGPQPRPGSLLVGSTARGTLSETDATADDNSFYDAYRVTLKEDEKLVILMVSNEVDSFVRVGRPKEDGEFEMLASDDDSLSDTHARLEWTAPSDGEYEIQAGSFQQGQTGAYALIVEKQQP